MPVLPTAPPAEAETREQRRNAVASQLDAADRDLAAALLLVTRTQAALDALRVLLRIPSAAPPAPPQPAGGAAPARGHAFEGLDGSWPDGRPPAWQDALGGMRVAPVVRLTVDGQHRIVRVEQPGLPPYHVANTAGSEDALPVDTIDRVVHFLVAADDLVNRGIADLARYHPAIRAALAARVAQERKQAGLEGA